MSNQLSDPLFTLIKSLNKAEKRNFSIYVGRLSQGPETKFLALFQMMEKQKKYDEGEIKKNLPIENMTQFANLKRHLFTQILIKL